ncbi:copper chaperone PCu(A)C [Thioalkalivibrio sp. AKL19]|uniref:copper chaperone PCu(A)C n=1 Tax=Thioalkalivibrio sp. AKL19 TaxID=1266914 RepID=UPI0003FD77D3|nr:copper chaperone PCu(A)C [Thioalkalivibrio sp. AKL19]
MKRSKRFLGGLLVSGLLASGFAAPLAADEPQICECREGLEMEGTPWIRLMPGDMTGGYFVLRNHGERDYRIVAADAPISEVVELHEHAHVDGVMRMRQVDGLEIPAGERLLLEPGGLHLMFIRLHEPLTAGDWIPVILEFDDGGTMEIHARVQRGEGSSDSHSRGHMMDDDTHPMDPEHGQHGH